MSEKSTRQSNLDLLRMVGMIMVILVHYTGHGGGFYVVESMQKNQAMFLQIGGQIGVNVFLLISGYFMGRRRFSIEHLLRILFEVFFYSVLVTVALAALGLVPWSALDISRFFPVITNQYWFATAYVVLMLLSPFFNAFVRTATRRQFTTLLLAFFVLIAIVPLFTKREFPIYYFWLLYLTGAYVQKHGIPVLRRWWAAGLCYAAGYGAVYASMRILYSRWAYEPAVKDFAADRMTWGYMPWILLLSLLLFLTFERLPLRHSRLITVLSGAAFGVYLIHDHPLMREILWSQIVKTGNVFLNPRYGLYALGAALAIYAVCTALDLVRIYAVERPVFRLYRKLFQKNREDNA